MALSKKPKTAGEVKSKCAKCKDVTLHSIVALKGEEIAKVKCLSCDSEHKFYPPKEAAETKKAAGSDDKAARPRVVKGKTARGADDKPQAPMVSTEWVAALAHVPEDRIKPYILSGIYQKNDFVSHPTFGNGLVQEIHGNNKMDVLFEYGPKLLVFNFRKNE